jgi:hypothetical protein
MTNLNITLAASSMKNIITIATPISNKARQAINPIRHNKKKIVSKIPSIKRFIPLINLAMRE